MPNQSEQSAPWEQSMRDVLRQSVPFFQAALIGTFAAAMIAGVAMLMTHS